MKLIRFGEPGNERPGILMNDLRFDVSSIVKDYDEAFFASNGIQTLRAALDTYRLPEVPASARWASCVARPSKIVCIGLNFADHAAESNMQLPAEPVVFFKATSSLAGPYDELIIPRNSVKTDWEVELAVVIGKKASYVTEEDAMNHVAGYCLHNDYSERTFQLERGGQWVKGKSCDTFAPLGPWMATTDEITDPGNLGMWLTVNGKVMQDSNTSNMYFKIPFLVSYLSQFMSLLPGDVISTGTPHGVGMGQKPEPIYVRSGDVIELGIDGLGTSRQVAREFED
ncbi:MAG TPA: fumarylacetoacetate hydrolase family protein [Chitinophagaceae bacterium]|nr:fumarylacetoacetate hydrolase family protein [Chitinophagaceae bacterium]